MFVCSHKAWCAGTAVSSRAIWPNNDVRLLDMSSVSDVSFVCLHYASLVMWSRQLTRSSCLWHRKWNASSFLMSEASSVTPYRLAVYRNYWTRWKQRSSFYRASAKLAQRDIGFQFCQSVCPSRCGIVSKRIHLLSNFAHHLLGALA